MGLSMNFYSQNGEDFLLWEAFKGKLTGFFLDIGALDGVHLSNTLLFEKHGWKGLCVEAHAGYIDALKKNRPNSVCEHCAISDKDLDNQDFYASALGSFSSISLDFVNFFQQHFGKEKLDYKIDKVNFRTIDTVLSKNAVTHVDFVSLDIEGTEYEALTRFDLGKYAPLVIVVEVLSPERSKLIDTLMLRNNYMLARRVKQNAFYCLDNNITKKIATTAIDCKLTHSPQPLRKM
jgi:FkbM family methyltransferase